MAQSVINLFYFPRGAALARRALRPARSIRRLRDRAHDGGVPVIYVNDNWGRWRSDFKAIVADCSRPERAGAPIAKLLEPTSRDFFVLKPHLSGFHDTPLDPLLQDLDYRVATAAKKAGCVFALDSDAHAANQLWMVDYAIAHARLAGIPANRIINCWPAADILNWARNFSPVQGV